MTLLSSAKVGLSFVWEVSAMALRYVLARPTGGPRDWGAEAYLLHPRCCRTEHYFKEHR